jgi:hypothetical protein
MERRLVRDGVEKFDNDGRALPAAVTLTALVNDSGICR